ncbi:MAG TPA: hypothetical protein VFK22_03530 [Candidatus Dormibacteraeota bacterium]|nr:hypothetical protein [Candidatus Dormibacteraeota bacterium]
MMRLRRLVEEPRIVDAVVVVLSTGFVLGAYVVAYAYVHQPDEVIDSVAAVGKSIVAASWSLLTLYLFAGFATGLGSGRAWNRALPDGETGTFAAALAFGAAWVLDDSLWTPYFGGGALGLEALFTPPHLIEMAAAAVIVSGPLRAATRRGETVATPIALMSATLLLSSVTFATQFAHPLIDPWPARDYEFRSQALSWVRENVGMASLLAQAAILAGTGLLLNSAFRVRPGSLTFVFTVNGLFVTITKGNFHLLPVPIATGVVADVFLAWASRRPGRPSASLTGIIGGTYALAYMLDLSLRPPGTDWTVSLWTGAIIASTMLSWLMGRVLRAGLPAAVIEPYVVIPEAAVPEKWTLDPDSTAREQLVRAALDDLGTPEALGRSPLARLSVVSSTDSAANELRALLIDVIGELATSASPRDAEAGHLLLDYYVKKSGSHEVIMERLHLSRPTYYRRLHHGFELVANRIDALSTSSRAPSAR